MSTIFIVVFALGVLLVLATFLSKAGQLSRALRGFAYRPVEIRVWGQPIPGARQIHSIRTIVAGLHLFITCEDGSTHDLKVAQPRDASVGEDAAEIREAAYVQWAKRKLPRAAGVPAVTLSCRS
ncbi:MAG TPA: hypothetical protein VNI54_15830 [Thermoanaerobaculia bacterium]|nr:hypothetical protein [Thermoanaerobaculia bacterium]